MNKPQNETTTPKNKIGDYEIYYKPCNNCGYDTAKSTKLEKPRCWRCGRNIQRDFSDRALKKKEPTNQQNQ